MKRKVAIIGAFDRFNYGDLLFPVILERVIKIYKNDLDIDFYGLIDSDLSIFGGVKTKSMSRLFNEELPEGSIVIISGGEVIGARWHYMHECVLSNPTKFAIKLRRKILGSENADKLSARELDSRLLQPWIISPQDFKTEIKVIYNTVGGSGLENLPEEYKQDIAKKFSESKIITVRDNKTKSSIEEIVPNINVDLAPDSAIIMSELFPVQELMKLAKKETLELINKSQSNRYICFQIGLSYAKNNEQEIAQELDKLYKQFGYQIILLPIGRASEHEDQVALSKIKSYMDAPTIIPSENSIYDIMLLIAKSQLFIGTSLHGCITALSFAIPHIAIDKRVTKLEEFLKTWDLPEQAVCVDFEHVTKKAHELLNVPQEKLIKKRNSLIKKSRTHFEKIVKAL